MEDNEAKLTQYLMDQVNKAQEDEVNNPKHYTYNGLECIDVMVAIFGVRAVKWFCICNAFKYIWRFQHKNGTQDIEKAKWYLNKYLELGGRDGNK